MAADDEQASRRATVLEHAGDLPSAKCRDAARSCNALPNDLRRILGKASHKIDDCRMHITAFTQVSKPILDESAATEACVPSLTHGQCETLAGVLDRLDPPFIRSSGREK
jgi:hypothetical protein